MKSQSPFPLLLIFWILGSCKANSQDSTCEQTGPQYISTQNGCLYFKSYKTDSISAHPNLVFIIHGDAPFNPPSYQYKLAQKLVSQLKNTLIISVLRPGYKDLDENRSDGVRGLTTGDNYTPEVISSITSVIDQLKLKYKPSQTLIVGHSGGAAISADLVSINPNLADKAVLVSCPCDVKEFRKYMSNKQPFYKPWKDSVRSVSPIDLLDNLQMKTKLVFIHGKTDDIVPVKIIEAYLQKLKEHKIKNEYILIENEGHEIFQSNTVINKIQTEVMSQN